MDNIPKCPVGPVLVIRILTHSFKNLSIILQSCSASDV